MIPVGGILTGKYRVERVLGHGGMGVVVQATHLHLGQSVAVKFLLPEVLANTQVVQRFLREAQAAVQLKGEHVARVIDVGTLETGAPYMVLEYLEGTDLSRFPRNQLTAGLIVDLMLQACEALAEAHALGIVHRDIKPANLFVTRRADGSLLLKILDFGISKTPASLDGALTGTQVVMGTPGYMSPEQLRSTRSVDHRSDLWSLGVVLYELLQGNAPFHADTFSSMVIKVVTDPLPPITVRLPGRLHEIVYRCLEKDVARRFQNVAELARALAPYAQSPAQAAASIERTSGMIASASALQSAAGTSPSTITGAVGALTQVPRGRSRWPILAGGAAAILVIAVVIAVSRPGGGAAGNLAAPTPAAPSDPTPRPAAGTPPAPAPAPAVPAPPARAEAPAAPPPSPAPSAPPPGTHPDVPPPAAATPPPATAPVRQPPVAAPVASPPPASPPQTTAAPARKSKPRSPVKQPPDAGSAAKPDDILDTRN